MLKQYVMKLRGVVEVTLRGFLTLMLWRSTLNLLLCYAFSKNLTYWMGEMLRTRAGCL